MTGEALYIDTSALLKRYILEVGTSEINAFFPLNAPFAISRLTMLEARCALARRCRGGQISATLEERALQAIRLDIQDGTLILHQVTDRQLSTAFDLVEQFRPTIGLRSLDAIHLAIASESNVRAFVTADKTQADAARQLGFTVYPFIDEKTS